MSKVYVEPDYKLLFIIEYFRNNSDYSKLVSYIRNIDIGKLNEPIKFLQLFQLKLDNIIYRYVM